MTKTSLKEISLFFLKLGTIAFGGPAAHIAMMEDEVVHKKKWLTQDKFIDLLGASNLIPGPSSTELAIYIGYTQAGWRGLLLAGFCFILPAVLIVSVIARFYVLYGNLPEISGILYGIKPIVIIIIIKALWNLGKTALKSRLLITFAIFATILNFLGLNPLAVLFGVGILMALKQIVSNNHIKNNSKMFAILPVNMIASSLPNVVNTNSSNLYLLFLIFLKIGAVLYGSGYVLLAFLQTDLVEHLGWLTQQQLLDAVAVGQFTPGPVFSTATFIGYILNGWKGATVATVGIFLPSFLFVAATSPFIPKLRKSAIFSAFLDGVNASAVSLMLVVTLKLIGGAFIDPLTIILGLIALGLLFFTSINSAWLILLGGVVGYFFHA